MPRVNSSQREKTVSTTEEQSVAPVSINASGHVQELDRNFNLLSICAVGVVTGNAWTAAGGTIVSMPSDISQNERPDQMQAVAIFNGGPAGVLYEL